MPFTFFHAYLPEVARRETRSVHVFTSGPGDPPPGEYGLLEMYCDEPGCDCRRVFFNVVSSRTRSAVAVVAYGWEPAEFYAKWAREDDPAVVRQIKGPILNLGSPQSEHADDVLRFIEDVVLRDPAYVSRLKAHYDLFKRQVEERARSKRGAGARRRRTHRRTRRPVPPAEWPDRRAPKLTSPVIARRPAHSPGSRRSAGARRRRSTA